MGAPFPRVIGLSGRLRRFREVANRSLSERNVGRCPHAATAGRGIERSALALLVYASTAQERLFGDGAAVLFAAADWPSDWLHVLCVWLGYWGQGWWPDLRPLAVLAGFESPACALVVVDARAPPLGTESAAIRELSLFPSIVAHCQRGASPNDRLQQSRAELEFRLSMREVTALPDGHYREVPKGPWTRGRRSSGGLSAMRTN